VTRIIVHVWATLLNCKKEVGNTDGLPWLQTYNWPI